MQAVPEKERAGGMRPIEGRGSLLYLTQSLIQFLGLGQNGR